jgi:hypothetical protein
MRDALLHGMECVACRLHRPGKQTVRVADKKMGQTRRTGLAHCRSGERASTSAPDSPPVRGRKRGGSLRRQCDPIRRLRAFYHVASDVTLKMRGKR